MRACDSIGFFSTMPSFQRRARCRLFSLAIRAAPAYVRLSSTTKLRASVAERPEPQVSQSACHTPTPRPGIHNLRDERESPNLCSDIIGEKHAAMTTCLRTLRYDGVYTVVRQEVSFPNRGGGAKAPSVNNGIGWFGQDAAIGRMPART